VLEACFNYLTTHGRGGKGTVLCFSAANWGYVDMTGGTTLSAIAMSPKTIAVGSSVGCHLASPVVAASKHPNWDGQIYNIAVGTDTRSLYSPYGHPSSRKPDLVSPSSTAMKRPPVPAGVTHNVDPVVCCVPTGSGVDGCANPLPACDDYHETFGGTSHSCPTVAGAVALILTANPDLKWCEVRDILRVSSVRIDPHPPTAAGNWMDLDGDGLPDYSRWYGAGRLDVDAAVRLTIEARNTYPGPWVPIDEAKYRAIWSGLGVVPTQDCT
jgi:subtilisin family serine protease